MLAVSQVVQKRIYSSRADVGIVIEIPGSIEQGAGVVSAGGTDEQIVIKWIEVTAPGIGVALEIPIGAEEAVGIPALDDSVANVVTVGVDAAGANVWIGRHVPIGVEQGIGPEGSDQAAYRDAGQRSGPGHRPLHGRCGGADPAADWTHCESHPSNETGEAGAASAHVVSRPDTTGR
jgi:hypothetical protein